MKYVSTFLLIVLFFTLVNLTHGKSKTKNTLEAVKCYACNPEGHEIGPTGKNLPNKKRKTASNLYEKGSCRDFHKADETTRKGFKFTKTCIGGCLWGNTDTKYTATASQSGLSIEEKTLNLFENFKGCFGTGTDHGEPLKMGGCVKVRADTEDPQSMSHPDNGDVIIRTKGFTGTHTICGCNKDYCNHVDKE